MNNKPEHEKGSVLNRQATEQRIVYRMKHITYWQQFESKKGLHKIVNAILFKMQKVSGEFLIEPRLLQKFFLLYLNKFHPSQQNLQRALNVTRVYSLLVHQFYKSAKKFKMHASFYVSPSVWQKWFIGRKAKENSLLLLKEIGLIIYYRFNRRKHTIAQNSRFVIMYQLKLNKVKWLYGCIKTIASFENEDNLFYQENNKKHSYTYDDIIADDLGFIERECMSD